MEIRIKGKIAFDRYLTEVDPESQKFSVRILMDKAEAIKVDTACKTVQKENPTKKLKYTISSGSEKNPENEHYAGRYYINAKSKFAIKFVNRAAKPVTAPDTIHELFYSGVDAIFAVSLYTYNHPSQGAGIGFGIAGIQSLETGERIMSDGPSFEPFEPVDGFGADDNIGNSDLF